MKNIITKIRNIVLWIVLVLVLIWIVGTALFLLFPKIQRTAIRLVLFYYKVPLYIDYDSAKLTPGYFRFTDIFVVYSSEKDTIMASVDTLELYYSSGKPILAHKIRLVNPKVDYRSVPTKTKSKASKISLPDVVVKKIEILNGDFKANGFSLENLNVVGKLQTEKEIDNITRISIGLDTFSCNMPSRANIHFASGDINFFRNIIDAHLSVELDSTDAELSMKNYDLSKNTFDIISFSGDKIDLTEIGRLISLDFLDGSGAGDFEVSMKNSGMLDMDFSFDGKLWGIPMVLNNTHLRFDDSLAMVTVLEKRGKIWGSNVSDVELEFFTDTDPMKYHFQIGKIENFDLDVFNIASTSLFGSVDISGSGFKDNMQLKIEAQLLAGNYDNFEFDGGHFFVNIDSTGTSFPADKDTSFAFIDNDTVMLWGKIDDESNIHLYCDVRAYKPDTLLKAFGYDYDISGYIGGRIQIIGEDKKTGIIVSLRGKNVSGYSVSVDRIRIEGQIKDLDENIGNFIVVGAGGNILSVPLDSLSLTLRTGKGKYFFRPLILYSQKGKLRATGMLFSGDSLSLRLDGLTFDKIGNISLVSPVVISLENGVSCKNIYLSAFEGIVKMKTLTYTDSLLKISGKMEGINLKKFSDMVDTTLKIQGNAKGHFDWEVNPTNYVGAGNFDLYVAPLVARDFVFSSFSATGKYHSDTLDIVHCYARRPDEVANLNGWIAFGDTIPSLHLEFSANGKRPGLIENFSPEITPIAGKYVINLLVDGNLNSPKFSGNASLDSGSFKISELDNPLDNITIRAKISGKKIELTKFSAESKATPLGNSGLFSKLFSSIFGQKFVSGTMSASGTVELTDKGPPKINISGKIDKFPLRSTEKGYYIVPDGTFDFVSPPMHLDGNIEIVDGTILQLGSPSPEPTKLPIPINISVATDNLWVLTKGLQGDMEAKIDGSLFITTADRKVSLLGRLNIDDGKYFVYGQTFTVESGQLDFKQISMIDPKLDITAKTTMGEEDVFLHITGTLSAPELELSSSNPDFSQEDILRLFAGISDSTVFYDALQERTQDLLEQYLAHNIEQMAQKTLGVDEFVIEPATENGSYFNPSDLRLTVGKRITGGLFLRYSQTLSDSAQQQFEAEYRFSRHFSIGAMQTPEGSYKLKVNLRWEY